MERKVALLRGINVGKAKRVAMADLRAWLEALGYTRVRTLLNSGNVVFDAPASVDDAAQIEEAIQRGAGFTSRVTVITAAELDAVVRDNPLEVHEPSRFLATWVTAAADVARLDPLLARDWAPDALAVVGRVAYQRCAAGLLDSAMAAAVGKALGDGCTARNWATVLKLQALAAEGRPLVVKATGR